MGLFAHCVEKEKHDNKIIAKPKIYLLIPKTLSFVLKIRGRFK